MSETNLNLAETEEEFIDIIDDYVDERMDVKTAIDNLVQHAGDYVTPQMMARFKMALYRLGTDGLTSIIRDKYGYYFEEAMENNNDEIETFILTEIFGGDYGIIPKNDEVEALVRAIRKLNRRIANNLKVERILQNKIHTSEMQATNNVTNEEEAEKRVNNTPDLSSEIKKAFGTSVDTLNELSNDQEIREVDRMVFTGNSGYIEAIRYIQMIPEFKNLFQLGSVLAEEFVDKLLINFQKHKESSDNNCYANVLKLLFRTSDAYKKNLTCPSIKELFLLYFFQEVFIRFSKYCLNEFSKKQKCDLNKAMLHIEKLFKKTFGKDHKYYYILSKFFEDYYRITHLIKNAGSDLKETFGSGKEIADEELQYLEDEVQMLFNSRTLPIKKTQIGAFELCSNIPNRKEVTHYVRQFVLATVKLEFAPPNKEIKYVISLTINRYSGEITINNGFIPLSEFVDKKTYRGIKKAVYEFLFETLLDRPADLAEIEAKPCIIREKTTSQVQEVLPEAEEIIDIETAVTQEIVTDESLIQRRKKKESSRYRKLSGLSCSRVRDVLTRLLGSPITQTGSSHFRYHRKNAEGTFPIPIHPGRRMPAGILVRCLGEYGIDIEAFLKEY